MGSYSFANCSSINGRVKIPNKVTSIDESTFYSCSAIDTIILPDSLQHIGKNAFANCTNITGNISIPGTCSIIDSNAFANCDNIIALDIDNAKTSIGNHSFISCDRLVSVNLGDSATSIGNLAFKDCFRLNNVQMGNSVASIGNNAFEYCTNLKNVTIESANIYIAAAGVSNSHAGRILGYAKTINVLASVVDDTNNTNSFLNDTTKYTKSAKHVIGDDNKEYYTYTKVS